MIDIGDYLHASLMYRDKKSFYDTDGWLETGYTITEKQLREKQTSILIGEILIVEDKWDWLSMVVPLIIMERILR